jgi:hypothetical protein
MSSSGKCGNLNFRLKKLGDNGVVAPRQPDLQPRRETGKVAPQLAIALRVRGLNKLCASFFHSFAAGVPERELNSPGAESIRTNRITICSSTLLAG